MRAKADQARLQKQQTEVADADVFQSERSDKLQPGEISRKNISRL